jgi:hypothetical protein
MKRIIEASPTRVYRRPKGLGFVVFKARTKSVGNALIAYAGISGCLVRTARNDVPGRDEVLIQGPDPSAVHAFS